ncbi:MAG: Ferredoxin [Syntrophus sp. PtaB.Bin001]|nr:MAG: Ferredoxin [Syntrophus sp. PtaB.Bin001]
MPLVLIRRSSYRYEALKPLVFTMLDRLGGGRISSRSRVLIKPNLLAPATPQQALLTHPSVVRAVVEYAVEHGARPLIADSPAMGSFSKIIRESGIQEAIAPFDVECRPFQESMKIDIGEPFGFIDIAREAIESDVIINLPKLKTHSQMLLTLGVKNLFGCIVGYRKPEWHMKTGVNRPLFARFLVQLYQRISPAFTILDGILALEGEGPGKRGNPKEVGLLLGSDSALALDRAVCRILELDTDQVPVLKAAAGLGLLEEAFDIDGLLEPFRSFRLPKTSPSLLYGPQSLQRLIRLYCLPRPVAEADLCRYCGACWTICPAKAIDGTTRPLEFDYDRCIRCCCCIEVCPHAALHTVDHFPARMIRKFMDRLR